MTSDYTIRYRGKIYQIGKSDVRPGLRGGRVRVEQRLDGSLAVQFRQRLLSVTECQPQPKMPPPAVQRSRTARVLRSPRAVRSQWMKNFNLQKSPPLWTILNPEITGVAHESG